MAPRTDAPVRSKATPAKREERLSPLGVVAPPAIHVESPRFTGSLATLFTCVKDRKVDLLDVPLFPICEAYFSYLLQAAIEDLDEAAAALAALAYLLERKAWALLPTPEPEPESEEALELLMPTSHEYRAAIEALREWQEEREKRFFRPQEAGPDPYELPFVLGSVNINDLARALERVLQRAEPEPVQPLGKPRRSLSEQMSIIMKRLSNTWVGFEALLEERFTRSDVVYSFLAVLELVRLGQATSRLHEDQVQFAAKGARR
jgi:segregation and condensation protein A